MHVRQVCTTGALALSCKVVWFRAARISVSPFSPWSVQQSRTPAVQCAAEPHPRCTAADTRQSRDKYRREKVLPMSRTNI